MYKRQEYFSTPEDIIEIALTLVEERRKRELDPTLTLLRQTLMEEPVDAAEEHAHDRMQQMCNLMEMVSSWSHDIQKLSPSEVERLLKLGRAVPHLLKMKDKFSIVGKNSDNEP